MAYIGPVTCTTGSKTRKHCPETSWAAVGQRPDTMARLGFGYEAVSERHPRLIYAACSGFGQTGPDSQRPAYDMVVQGMGGIMSLTGHEGGEPTRVGTAIGDITAGMFTAIGINAALYERECSGRGQFIDIAMLDCQVAILENAIARYFTTGETPGPSGARHPAIAPFECYRSGDGHIIMAAGNDALFVRLCEALDMARLSSNPLFSTNSLRMQHVEALKVELEAVLTTDTTEHWLAKLEAAGVPCGPLNTVAHTVSHRQVLARNMVGGIDDPKAGPIKMPAHPDPESRGAVPELDGDRARILAQFSSG